MKHILLILLCTICLVQTMKAVNDVPSVVITGLDAYRTNGLRSAFEIWGKGTMENDKASRDMVLTGLSQVESAYGKMIGYDIVKTVPIGSVVRRIYLVVHYENGPVYAYMDCYKADEKWLVTDLLFHTKANLVFPPGLLGS